MEMAAQMPPTPILSLEAALADLCVMLLQSGVLVTADKPWAIFFAMNVSPPARERLFRAAYPTTPLPDHPHQLIEAVTRLLTQTESTAGLTLTPDDLSGLRANQLLRLVSEVTRAQQRGRSDPRLIQVAMQQLQQRVAAGEIRFNPEFWTAVTPTQLATAEFHDFLNILALAAGDWDES